MKTASQFIFISTDPSELADCNDNKEIRGNYSSNSGESVAIADNLQEYGCITTAKHVFTTLTRPTILNGFFHFMN